MIPQNWEEYWRNFYYCFPQQNSVYFAKTKQDFKKATIFTIIIHIEGSIFLKNRHFVSQERFNKLIYGINTIIKCSLWQPVKLQLG